MILDFLKKKNDPFLNRHFYQKLYQEQEHSEKIKVLGEMTEKIQKVLKEDDPFLMAQQNGVSSPNSSMI